MRSTNGGLRKSCLDLRGNFLFVFVIADFVKSSNDHENFLCKIVKHGEKLDSALVIKGVGVASFLIIVASHIIFKGTKFLRWPGGFVVFSIL